MRREKGQRADTVQHSAILVPRGRITVRHTQRTMGDFMAVRSLLLKVFQKQERALGSKCGVPAVPFTPGNCAIFVRGGKKYSLKPDKAK